MNTRKTVKLPLLPWQLEKNVKLPLLPKLIKFEKSEIQRRNEEQVLKSIEQHKIHQVHVYANIMKEVQNH